MAVGRLTHLAHQVTLPTSSSAAVTVPNDGSVAAGDLLLVGCVMPSGSRTFAISGAAGSWTSLGTASQSGHLSQTWWKIAAVGDLGATITVTPSTGNIRQVLLLGKVSGAHAATPVFGSNNNTTTQQVKTTPTVGSAPAGCREISIVWDSRGASTPQTSNWTAPAGETRQTQAFTTSGSGASSGAWGDSDTTVSGTIGARDWTPDQPAIGSAWTLAIQAGATEQALTAATETDTAQTLARAKTRLLGTAAQTGTAQSATGSKQGALAPAAQAIETAQALAGVKAGTLAPAVEQDAAQALTGAKTTLLGTADAVEAAQALTGGKTHGLATVTATETAQPLTARAARALTAAATTETAQPLTGSKSLALAPAVETDAAIALTSPGGVPGDVDYTIGAPAGRWKTGAPAARWATGAPAARWKVGEPWI